VATCLQSDGRLARERGEVIAGSAGIVLYVSAWRLECTERRIDRRVVTGVRGRVREGCGTEAREGCRSQHSGTYGWRKRARANLVGRWTAEARPDRVGHSSLDRRPHPPLARPPPPTVHRVSPPYRFPLSASSPPIPTTPAPIRRRRDAPHQSHGNRPGIHRPARSSRPAIRLKHCTAWPEAPLTRLSSPKRRSPARPGIRDQPDVAQIGVQHVLSLWQAAFLQYAHE